MPNKNKKQNLKKSESRNNTNCIGNHNNSINNTSNDININVNRTKWAIK